MASSKTVYDNLTAFYGGMNGNLLSSTLGERQYLRGINITCRGGVIRTRPGFSMVDLRFANDADEHIFETGKWQGATSYHGIYGTYLIAAVSGNVFMIEPDTWRVANVTAVTGRLNQYVDRLFFCQAEQYMIIQDGINRGIILDGFVAARSDASKKQVPVGTIMAYGHGRIFVKVFGNQFLAGDINQPTVPTAVLQFTETTYLNGGGAFGLPSDLGEITGMAFSQNFDSSDGQGPLVVFARNGSDTFAVYNPRDYWADSDISRVQIRGVGCASKDCIIVTGDDLIFRTYDGIGSYDLFKTSDRRFTDMAQELMPFENQETQWCRSLSSGVLFDNRILYTMVAEKVECKNLEGETIDDIRFKALGVLDLAPLNGLTEISKNRLAVYDGAWTGPNPLQIVTGNFDNETRCFVFGKTDSGANILYELGKDPGNDCEDDRVNCRFYPKYVRFYDFSGTTPIEQTYWFKRLDKCALYVPRFEGQVDFKWWVKPDGRTDFKQVSAMTVMSPMVAAEPPYASLTGGMAQARAKLTFPQFKTLLGDPVKGINQLNAYEYEFMLEWDGIAEIRRISLEATIQDRAPDFTPDRNVILPASERSDFDYSISCPEVRYLPSGLIYSDLVIRLGNFAYWTMADIPGVVAVDENGNVVDNNIPQTGDSTLRFYQDPAADPTWQQMPDFTWPAGTPTPPLPPTPTNTGMPRNPAWLTIPKPPVTRYSSDPTVPPATTKDDGTVPVIPLNEIAYAVLRVECYNQAGDTKITSINRGDPFKVKLSAFKYFEKIDSTGAKTVYLQPWKNPGSSLVASLSVANPLEYPGPSGPVINGDLFQPADTNITWNANGEVFIDGIVDGGSIAENDIEIRATAHIPLNVYGTSLAGRSKMLRVLAANPTMIVSPDSAAVSMTEGDGSTTVNLTIENTQIGTELQWNASLINVDAALVGKISVSPSAYSGSGLAGGTSEPIVVTILEPVAGTYNATVHFATGDLEVDVPFVVTLTALPATVSVTFVGLLQHYNIIMGMVQFLGGTYVCAKSGATYSATNLGGVGGYITLTQSGGYWRCKIGINWPGIAVTWTQWKSATLTGSFVFDTNNPGGSEDQVTAVSSV